MENKASEKQALRILFLASNPAEQSRLLLAKEVQEIANRLASKPYFEMKTDVAIRPDDVLQAIMSYKPHIVHFSGGGNNAGQLCFQDEAGNSKSIPPDALASLFNLVAEYVKCVLLNTCYSENQAKAISQYVPVVIGTKTEIADTDAIRFSTGFYTSLEADLSQSSLEKAFNLGRVAIQFDGNLQEHLMPVILFSSPDIRFIAEVETAFSNISNPMATINKILIRGLSLKGDAMGLSPDVVDSIINTRMKKLQDYKAGLAEYESNLRDALRDEFPPSETTLSALSYLQNGLGLRNEDVIAIQNKLLSDPKMDSAYSWYDRGRGQTDLNNYEKAIEYCSKAIERNPEYSGAWFERGYAYDRLQQYGYAIADFSKAIEHNSYWEVSSNLGLGYFYRGLSYYSMQPQTMENITNSMEDWSRSIELNPNDPNAYLNRGLAYQFLREFDKAIADYKTSLEMDTSSNKIKASTVTNIVRCYAELGKQDEITKWTAKGLELLGKNPAAYNMPDVVAENSN